MKTELNDKMTSNHACPFHADNNVDLVHVFETARKNWRTCFFIITISFIFSVIYAYALPKEYSVEAVFLPPDESSVNSMHIPGYNSYLNNNTLFHTSIGKIYFQFLDNLRSSWLRFEYFKNTSVLKNIIAEYDEGYSDYKIFDLTINSKIKIIHDEGVAGATKFIRIQFLGSDPRESADVLNGYVEYVDRKTIYFAQQALKSKIAIEKESVNGKILSLRVGAEKKRTNKLSQIIEDIKIAEQLNIVDPAHISFKSYSQSISSKTGIFENSNETPGYLKGVKMLKAEFESLNNRKDDDPFIPGILILIEEKEYLNKISQIIFEGIHAARIDRAATPPMKATKPVKLLVITVGIVFGLLIAIFVILVNVIIDKRVRKQGGT